MTGAADDIGLASVGQIAIVADDVARATAFYRRAAPHRAHARPRHDLWMAFLRDSEGHLLGLMSERPR